MYRIIGSGATVQSVLRWSCRGRERYSFIPRWNEEVATLEAFEQRVRDTRVVLDFSPEGDTFRHVRDILTDLQLEAADGSGAQMIVKTIRLSVGPESTQEGVRLLWDFFILDSLRRNGGTKRHWTRFTL